MSFRPVRYDSGKATTMLLAASQAVTKGDALEINSAGFLALATSSTTEVRFVALETKTSGGATGESILVVRTDGVEFEADTAGTPAQTDVGEYCDLTDEDTLNEAASSTDVFLITHILDAANKIVLGKFVQKTS